MNIEQFSKEHLSAVLDAFIRVKGGEINGYGSGICYNASYISEQLDEDFDAYAVVETFSLGWPKHSGKRRAYPIEGSYCGNLWVGTQGALRYELLDFLIDELTKVVNNDEQKVTCTVEWYEGELPNH